MSQNHMSPNLPMAGQSPNPLQNNGVSLSNHPLTIPSMLNMQNNVPNNKPQPGPGFPGSMKTFAGMPRPQFPNQQSILRSKLPAGTFAAEKYYTMILREKFFYCSVNECKCTSFLQSHFSMPSSNYRFDDTSSCILNCSNVKSF